MAEYEPGATPLEEADASTARQRDIATLKVADQGATELLLAFVRS